MTPILFAPSFYGPDELVCDVNRESIPNSGQPFCKLTLGYIEYSVRKLEWKNRIYDYKNLYKLFY